MQMWWARRPLAICRSAIFAALVPNPTALEDGSEFLKQLNALVPGDRDPVQKILDFTAKLSRWEACNDEELLEGARQIINLCHDEPPVVVDTFAGGGSFPIEAARLGLDAYGSDLNPVAVMALKAALELLPASGPSIISYYKEECVSIMKRLEAVSQRLYGQGEQETVLAFFWCRTYECPNCLIEVPLLHNRILASKSRKVIFILDQEETQKRFRFKIIENPDGRQSNAASKGTVSASGAECPGCMHHISTSELREYCGHTGMGDRLYAKRLKTADGRIRYETCSSFDERCADKSCLRAVRGRTQKSVPDEPFDINSIRHIWAIQYGIKSTKDLFNQRQGIALLEAFYEIQRSMERLSSEIADANERAALQVLLTLTFNRIIMYNSRHAWWQPNGEFPANMFVRQAIPMVWNYVEMPVTSPGAGGWKSSVGWISKVAEHCLKLPRFHELVKRTLRHVN